MDKKKPVSFCLFLCAFVLFLCSIIQPYHSTAEIELGDNYQLIQEIKMLNLPELLMLENGEKVETADQWRRRREEIIRLLSENVYGFLPPFFEKSKGEIIETTNKCCSGHAILEKVMITATTEKGEYSFPVSIVMPRTIEKVPVFVVLNFRSDIYDMYIPTEEIIDNKFGIVIINYEDIVPDCEPSETSQGEWDKGLAGFFSRPNDGTGFGYISLWAWGVSRVMDYLMIHPQIDNNFISLVGQSRLGKVALWCAANDERFFCAISNDSGCAGAALERGHHEGAETINDIVRFKSWFCDNYYTYTERIDELPIDQHFLIAAIAPRIVAIGSASEDKWADYISEQMSCIAASPAWEVLGREGYIGSYEAAKVGDVFSEGNISYHLRDGIHYLGREDWKVYMDFLSNHFSLASTEYN